MFYGMEILEMARQGISYSDVAGAANQLKGQGRNPTIEQIRMILGTGSSTTIANHLKSWKSTQSSNTQTALTQQIPEELLSTVQGLWQRIVSISEDKVQTINTEFQNTLKIKQDELDKYRNNNQRWQQLYHQWNAEKEKYHQDKKALQMLIENMKEEHMALQTKYKLTTQQLVEKQDRLQEVHHLQQQAQKNYESFQLASREQIQAERSEFNAQRKLSEKKISELEDRVTVTQGDFNTLRDQYKKVIHDRDALKAAYETRSAELAECKATLTDCRNMLHEHSSTAQHWQAQYRDAKKQIEIDTKRIIEGESQNKSLQDQLATAKLEINQLRQQSKQLERENWSLAQENMLLASQ